jgi:hypothetical protein
LILKPPRTKPSSFRRDNDEIRFTLVRPTYALAQEILAAYSNALVELSAAGPEASQSENVAAQLAYTRAVSPELAAQCFAENVTDVRGFCDEEGKPVVMTGPELLELVPDENLVMHVIAELRVMCMLGKAQPTRSSSASTSEPVGDPSPSTAQPIAECAAPEPTAAMASKDVALSSSE